MSSSPRSLLRLAALILAVLACGVGFSAGAAAGTELRIATVAPAVWRVARTVLGASNPDAEDAAQESLVAFVGAIERFRGECGVLHYACRIAVRISVAARRRARTASERLEGLRGESQATRGAPCADEIVAARRRNVVRSLIDELPDAQAETLALRFVLGCSLREVAEATGVPENTVRSRLRLAREALRRRIEEDPAMAGLLEDAG